MNKNLILEIGIMDCGFLLLTVTVTQSYQLDKSLSLRLSKSVSVFNNVLFEHEGFVHSFSDSPVTKNGPILFDLEFDLRPDFYWTLTRAL